jgi:hypothetical protein
MRLNPEKAKEINPLLDEQMVDASPVIFCQFGSRANR